MLSHVPYHIEFHRQMEHLKQIQTQEHLGDIPSSFQQPYFAFHPRFLVCLQLLRFPKKRKNKAYVFSAISLCDNNLTLLFL